MPLVLGVDSKDTSILKEITCVENKVNGDVALMVDTDMIKTTFTAEYSAAQTAVSMITPPSGYKVCVRDVFIRTNGNTGVVEIDFVTSSKLVDRLYAAAQNQSTNTSGHVLGAVDEPLKITTTTGANKVFVKVNYVLHK